MDGVFSTRAGRFITVEPNQKRFLGAGMNWEIGIDIYILDTMYRIDN